MGLGDPVAFRQGLESHACLGVDCHSNNSSDILIQMRLLLQHTRAVYNGEALRKGQYPSVDVKLEEVFNLGTIQGAKAINMEDQIGSLAVGKKADIVVFGTSSPSIVCAAEENPLAAILLHGSVRDIETVIFDGNVLKANSALRRVGIRDGLNTDNVTFSDWNEVARQVLQSRKKILDRATGQDISAGIAALQEVSHDG